MYNCHNYVFKYHVVFKRCLASHHHQQQPVHQHHINQDQPLTCC